MPSNLMANRANLRRMRTSSFINAELLSRTKSRSPFKNGKNQQRNIQILLLSTKEQKICCGNLSCHISPYQIISQMQICRKSRTLLLGRWRLHSTTIRKVYGPSTSKEERRVQNSREPRSRKKITSPL